FPAPLVYEGQRFVSSEQAYQWAKFPPGSATRSSILATEDSGQIKRLGRSSGSLNLPERERAIIMSRIVHETFKQNDGLLKALLQTENNVLIEGNYWHDNIWGVCWCNSCPGH